MRSASSGIELVGSVETSQIPRRSQLGHGFVESDSVAPNRATIVEQFERAQPLAAKLFVFPIVLIHAVRERGAQRVFGYLLQQRVVVDTLCNAR